MDDRERRKLVDSYIKKVDSDIESALDSSLDIPLWILKRLEDIKKGLSSDDIENYSYWMNEYDNEVSFAMKVLRESDGTLEREKIREDKIRDDEECDRVFLEMLDKFPLEVEEMVKKR